MWGAANGKITKQAPTIQDISTSECVMLEKEGKYEFRTVELICKF
jgi:hypothetical protein